MGVCIMYATNNACTQMFYIPSCNLGGQLHQLPTKKVWSQGHWGLCLGPLKTLGPKYIKIALCLFVCFFF